MVGEVKHGASRTWETVVGELLIEGEVMGGEAKDGVDRDSVNEGDVGETRRGAEEEDRKRRIRMERNRESAKRSRMKMKEYVEGMEDKLSSLQSENGVLLGRLSVLNNTMAALPSDLLNESAMRSLMDSARYVEAVRDRRTRRNPSTSSLLANES